MNKTLESHLMSRGQLGCSPNKKWGVRVELNGIRAKS